MQGRGKGWRKGLITKKAKPAGRGKGWRKGVIRNDRPGQRSEVELSRHRRTPPTASKLLVSFLIRICM